MNIASSRLHIRDLTTEDWPAVHALRTNPDVYRYNHFGPESEEETRTWIRETMVHNHLTPRSSHNCSISLRATGEVIGWIGFGLPSPDMASHSDLDFGYALLPAFWHQGFMSEAVRGMIDFLFTTTDATSAAATCDVRNIGSARVMEKAGLRQVERFAEVDDETGETTESYRHRILRCEWETELPKDGLRPVTWQIIDIVQTPEWRRGAAVAVDKSRGPGGRDSSRSSRVAWG